jgi:hypothetical protein
VTIDPPTATVNFGQTIDFVARLDNSDPVALPNITHWSLGDNSPLPDNFIVTGTINQILRIVSRTSVTIRVYVKDQFGKEFSATAVLTVLQPCMVGNETILPGESIRVFSLERNESASPRMADLVFIVDESRSMQNEHDWIKTMVISLERELRNFKIGSSEREPNRYALVGFGSPTPSLTRGRVIDLGGSFSPFGNATELVTGIDKLARLGDIEDGYAAIDVALDDLVFRELAARQFILASDEERDVFVDELTFNETLRRLKENRVKLNVVAKHRFGVKVDRQESFVLGLDGFMNAYAEDGRKMAGGFPYPESGYQSTYQDYVKLAFSTEGGAWDLNELRKDSTTIRNAFTNAFIQVKVEEIAGQLGAKCKECNCTDGQELCVVIPSVTTEIQCLSDLIPDLSVVISPSSIDEFIGRPVTFTCSATNIVLNSEVSLTWNPIPSNAKSVENKLVFDSITLENTGIYTCEARTATRYGIATASLAVIEGFPATVLKIRPSRDETVVAGEYVEFVCVAMGSPAPTIVWLDPYGIVIERQFPSLSASGSGLETKYTEKLETAKLSLLLREITEDDEGLYTCRAENDFGADNLTLQLTVHVEPHAQVSPQFVSGFAGLVIQLECTATGDPKPTITWLLEGRKLPDAVLENGNTLTVTIGYDTVGNYTCLADSVVGESRAEAFIEMEVPPRPDITTTLPSIIRIEEGLLLELEVLVVGFLNVSISWKRSIGDRPIEAFVTGRGGLSSPDSVNPGRYISVLSIHSVQLNHAGVYVCSATNEGGTSQRNFSVQVLSPLAATIVELFSSPAPAILGMNLLLSCSAQGNPPPQLVWLNPLNQTINQTLQSNVLGDDIAQVYLRHELSSVMIGNAGEYKCVASNRIGMDEGTVSIKILPTAILRPSRVDEYPGTSVRFNCLVTGFPSPGIAWLFNDRESLPSDVTASGGQLTVVVNENTKGKYTCVATNEVGKESDDATVSVLVPPIPRVTVTPKSATIQEGESLLLQCTVESVSPASALWTFTNGQTKNLTETSFLLSAILHFNITGAIPTQSGTYVCSGTNAGGTSIAQVSVTVEPIPTTMPPSTEPTPIIAVRPMTIVKRVGEGVVFRCIVQFGRVDSFEWFLNGGDVPSNAMVNDSVLTFKSLLGEERGRYSCAGIWQGGRVTGFAMLEVLSPISVTGEMNYATIAGENVNLSCYASGYPKPTIAWSKVDSALPRGHDVDGGHLFLSYVRLEDSGMYKCEASNPYETNALTVMLTVQEYPKVAVSQEQEAVYWNSTVSLKCSATGYPVPSIIWSRVDGKSLPATVNASSPVLYFESIQPGDEAEYKCTAQNTINLVKWNASKSLNLAVMDFPPSFFGSSFLTYALPNESGTEIHITIRFRPHKDTGLLLYSGNPPGSPIVDYFALGLVDGHVVLQFNSRGDLEISLRSASPVTLDEWHIVSIRHAQLIVDNQVTKRGSGRETDLAVQDRLYLGGHINYGEVLGDMAALSGFVGCVDRLGIRPGYDLDLYETLDMANIGKCFECPCQEGEVCVLLSNDFICHLPGEFTVSPSFNLTSFASYDGIDGESTQLEIEIIIRPDADNGLILYQGARERGTVNDFFSIGLVNGYVQFLFDNGDGTAILSSKQPVDLGVDHKIIAHRSGYSGYLGIDEEPELVVGDTGGSEERQRLTGNLYVGGMQDYHVLPKRSGQTVGFVGCVKKLIVQGVEGDLTKPVETANVDQCDVCGSKEPCMNRGECSVVSPGVKNCDCPFPGIYGDVCQHFVKFARPNFTGDGYIKYRADLLKGYAGGAKITVQFSVEAGVSDGLILYYGHPDAAKNGKDFIAIGMQDGNLVVRWRDEKGSKDLRALSATKPRELQTLDFIRTSMNQDGEIFVDNDLQDSLRASTKLVKFTVDDDAVVYLGGAENVSLLTNDLFTSGWKGCITKVLLAGTNRPLNDNLLEVSNVYECLVKEAGQECFFPTDSSPYCIDLDIE